MIKCTIATGINNLDVQLSKAIDGSNIVNYREYLLKDCAPVLIISEYLNGSIEFEKLLLELKKKDIRIILLLDSINNRRVYQALKLGIYDMLFDDEYEKGINIKDIVNVYNNPKKLSDFSKLIEAMGDFSGSDKLAETSMRITKQDGSQEKIVIKKVIEVQKEREYIPDESEKLVMSVWGSPEFACEMGYEIAKVKRCKVCILDLNIESPSAHNILNTIQGSHEGLFYTDTYFCKESILDTMLELLKRKRNITSEEFDVNCVRPKRLDNLYVIPCRHEFVEKFEEEKLQLIAELIELLYRNFFITIVICSKSVLNKYTIVALENSHRIIAAIEPTLQNFGDYLQYERYLKENTKVETKNIQYVAFNYDEKTSLDEDRIKGGGILKLPSYNLGSRYIGKVHTSGRRDYLQGHPSLRTFARRMGQQIEDDYLKILACYKILPKKKLGERLKNYFLNKARAIKKAARHLKRQFGS